MIHLYVNISINTNRIDGDSLSAHFVKRGILNLAARVRALPGTRQKYNNT